jgi:hypothetical protein
VELQRKVTVFLFFIKITVTTTVFSISALPMESTMHASVYITIVLMSMTEVCWSSFRMDKPNLKHNQDGSVMSNSGPTSAIEHLMKPTIHNLVKRTYIDPTPRYSSSMPFNPTDSNFIVNEHNKYRRIVPATNMQEVVWDTALAAQAQAHADACVLQHSTNRVNVGENIWAAPYSDFSGAVKMWFDEVYDTRCGCSNGFKECCGHYTQLVWADTNRVGCGYSYCPSITYAGGQHYMMVCQYSPAGNVLYVDNGGFVQAPAFYYRGDKGTACSSCPNGYSCDNGLCLYK